MNNPLVTALTQLVIDSPRAVSRPALSALAKVQAAHYNELVVNHGLFADVASRIVAGTSLSDYERLTLGPTWPGKKFLHPNPPPQAGV